MSPGGTPLLHLLLVLAAGLAALVPRLDGTPYVPGKYLWAEDGNVFLNDAAVHGIGSLLLPYAGYFHVYPRLVAWAANPFELLDRPAVLLAGWLSAYIVMLVAIHRAGLALGLGAFACGALAVLIPLQPHYGENFFNIVNSQWLLGTALFLLVLAEPVPAEREPPVRAVPIALLALSGPFSTLVLPLAVVRAFVLRDASRRVWTYGAVALGGAVQAMALMGSGRAAGASVGGTLSEWRQAVWLLLSFGADRPVETWAAAAVWALIVVSAVVACARGSGSDRRVFLALLLLAQAALMIASSLYSSKGQPFAVTSPGGGNRYTWIPYALIFASAAALSLRTRVVHLATFGTIGLLCFWNLHPVALPDLRFASFARFSRTVAQTIPIHPQWPAYPGWHVDAKSGPGAPVAAGTDLALDDASLRARDDVLTTLPITCGDATDLGVEVWMTREAEGWTRLAWSSSAEGPDTGSLRRWYPAGRVTAQYAFPMSAAPVVLRFVPTETAGAAALQRITVHCIR